jgi:DNA gyrase subunit A
VTGHLVAGAPEAAGPNGQGSLPGLGAAPPSAILVATARGFGFRTVPDLTETTRAGRKVARVGDADEIVSVQPLAGKTVVVAASSGKMLRFPAADVAELSGPGKGVTLLKPDPDGRVVGALALGDKETFIAVTPDGSERRIAVQDVPAGRRAGKGQKVVKRGGVAAIRRVEE